MTTFFWWATHRFCPIVGYRNIEAYEKEVNSQCYKTLHPALTTVNEKETVIDGCCCDAICIFFPLQIPNSLTLSSNIVHLIEL